MKNLKLLMLLFVFLIVSCNKMEFNKVDWLKKDDLSSYIYRDKMIKDLIENHKLVGLSHKEISELLGNAENYSDAEHNTIYYNIVTDYANDIDPVYIKNLRIKFNTFDKVESFNIEETK